MTPMLGAMGGRQDGCEVFYLQLLSLHQPPLWQFLTDSMVLMLRM